MTVLAALAACQTVAASPSAPPIPTATLPSPTLVPSIHVISHQLLRGSASGQWRVVGLVENQGQNIASQVQLDVSLIDETGVVIAAKPASTLLSNLQPDEVSPFLVSFESAATPTEALVELSQVEPATRTATSGLFSDVSQTESRPELYTQLEEFFVTGSGQLAIMGFVANPGNDHIALDSLGFLGRAPNDSENSLAEMQFGPNQLAPGDKAPFLALAPENPGAVRWTLYHDGLIGEPPGPNALAILGTPRLHLTAQGSPFVVGTLANSGKPASGTVLISLFDGSRLIGIWEFETPRSLEAGEQLPFTAFGFPGVNLRLDPGDPSAIRVETRVEETASDETPMLIDMPVDVSSILSVGSAIFIRGVVRNSLDIDVDAVAVYAEVRSSAGDLITAGWSTAGYLERGESKDFVLDLPIPVGMDATLTEYDLRGIGLKAQP